MFAVIKTGGKQYKVAQKDVLRIEKIVGVAGDIVQFNEVLLLGGKTPVVGAPMVANAGVQAEILEQAKAPKVIHYVKRRRKHSSQRTKGHRQQITVLRVKDILATGADKSGVMAAVNGAGFEVVIAPVKKAAKKPAVKKADKPADKPVVKKEAVKKPAAKKPAAKKPAVKKAPAKKPATKSADKT
ncbi:MAG: 50S ribosomal protein L21 [Candidatus Halichondribacter symbioticus]